MVKKRQIWGGVSVVLLAAIALPAGAQSFRVQCPDTTNLHTGHGEPGVIKCQEIGGTDGFATMGDGNQIYLFGFAPLSGLGNGASVPGILTGVEGTEPPAIFKSTTDDRRARIEPADIMNNGVLYANAPAPMIAIDEDDELFLTLSNVGMIMRPDLFEQHTVHFHGYPNASSFFDGVPDASVAINIAGSFTYYYTAPDPGTYFWHCHIAPPEHLQMGMVGQLFVRPRQNKVTGDLYAALKGANDANRAKVADTITPAGSCSDILCTGATPLPAINTGASNTGPVGGKKYAYNDGDGTTQYDVEVPLQIMGFDPNFHFVGMTFNPEAFSDMKDKYFLLNGRSYPDTINKDAITTQGSDGTLRPSQPLPALIILSKGTAPRALLRISDLSVTEHTTLATIGIPMQVIAQNARLLRDQAGNNLYYKTNSVTLGGGESADVILDATNIKPGTYFLYSTNLDHLSNDAENFGGQMTEIVVKN
jgi:FtsP/CotA-like multicopper oxidase with cupredoxin domain